jgi:hypothetical protein
MEWGTPRLIDFELVEGRCSGYNIHDTVEGSHLMEMDVFHGCPMDLCLGYRYKFENGDCSIDHRLGEPAFADNAADLPQAPVVLLFLVFGMAIVMMISMIMNMVMVVAVPVIMVMVMSVLTVSVVVIFRRIHVPSGLRINHVEFGPHQSALANLARPDAETFNPK